MLLMCSSVVAFILRLKALLAGYTTFLNRFGPPKGSGLFSPIHGSTRSLSSQKHFNA